MYMVQAFILGIIQGFAEFMPISSSGHLRIAESIMGVQVAGLFDVLLHVSCLFAVCMVFWKDIMHMIRHPIRSDLKWLVVATIPAVVIKLAEHFLSKKTGIDIEDYAGTYIYISFFLTSLILLLGRMAEHIRHKYNSQHKRVHFADSLLMGIAQAVAGILPGVSRSGSTISCGLATGLSRKRAIRFSFLMYIPATLGALVWDLKSLADESAETAVASGSVTPILIGTIVAACVSILVVRWLLHIFSKRNALVGFSIYTACLGLLTLVNNLLTHWIVIV